MGLTEAISFRFPYNGDAVLREKFNAGVIEYQDMHLSHAGSLVRYGYYGRPDNKIDFAVIEVTKISEDGSLVFSSSVRREHRLLRRGGEVHPRGERVAGRAARGDARHLRHHRQAR